MFIKKTAYKNYAEFTGKHLCCGHFLIMILLKRDSNTGVFMLILRNLQENSFTEHLRATASEFHLATMHCRKQQCNMNLTKYLKNRLTLTSTNIHYYPQNLLWFIISIANT